MKKIILSVFVNMLAGLFLTFHVALSGGAMGPTTQPTGKTYYIAADGNDGNSGLDPRHPFKTVAPINTLSVFGAGCEIRFKGGDTFAGPLNVTMTGTSNTPCYLASYGSGKATLVNVAPYTEPICKMINSEYVTVENLCFVGTPGTNYPGLFFVPANRSMGLSMTSIRRSGIRFRSIAVKDCMFKSTLQGLWIDCETGPNLDGIDGVKVVGCTFDGVYQFGCYITGPGRIAEGPVDHILNVYVAGNRFQNIYGDPHIPSEAQPLSVSGATEIVIEKNIFGNNCGFGGHYTGNPNGGSAALGVSNCRNFRIQRNEVFATKCADKWDGCAIDADEDSRNGEICYNLTYFNGGPAVQLGSFHGKLTQNIVVHHNISFNDVRGCQPGSIQGAIRLWGNNNQIQIINNTIFLDGAGVIGKPSCLNYEVGNNKNISIHNNIFRTKGCVPVIRPNGSAEGEYNSTHIDATCKFLGNCYDGGSGSLIISTDNINGRYVNIFSMPEWRSSGQERHAGSDCGLVGDAGLLSPGAFKPSAGGFLPDRQVSTVRNFDLNADSACRGRAIDPLPFVTLQSPMTFQREDYHGNLSSMAVIGAVQQ